MCIQKYEEGIEVKSIQNTPWSNEQFLISIWKIWSEDISAYIRYRFINWSEINVKYTMIKLIVSNERQKQFYQEIPLCTITRDISWNKPIGKTNHDK